MRCHKNKLNTKMAFRRIAQNFGLAHLMLRGAGSSVGGKSCVRDWPRAAKHGGRSREWAPLVACLPLWARAGTVLPTHSRRMAAAAMLPSPRRLSARSLSSLSILGCQVAECVGGDTDVVGHRIHRGPGRWGSPGWSQPLCCALGLGHSFPEAARL